MQARVNASPAVARLSALQRLADTRVAQLGKGNKSDKLITTTGSKYKKKEKERREAAEVAQTLDNQIRNWLGSYGHAQALHVGMSTANLDGRKKRVATTFETDDDLFQAVRELFAANEQKVNHWYANTDKPRLEIWVHCSPDVAVRGRRKQSPGYVDVSSDDLAYIIGVFDRDSWDNTPKGLITCYPSETTV
jgi:hypothetical protein